MAELVASPLILLLLGLTTFWGGVIRGLGSAGPPNNAGRVIDCAERRRCEVIEWVSLVVDCDCDCDCDCALASLTHLQVSDRSPPDPSCSFSTANE